MSLVGNLEDLGLGEILQIVSLSRKSGVLALRSGGREGQIVFHQGQVVRASSSATRLNIGDILVQKGIIGPDVLEQALAVQKSEGGKELIGAILINRFGISPDAIEGVVRELFESIVYSLFGWSEGTFDFELHDTIQVTDGFGLDPSQFKLSQGLNPQFLAMEGSRIIDEQRHRGELDDVPAAGMGEAPEDTVDFAFDMLQAEPPSPAAPPVSRRSLVLVDDHDDSRSAFQKLLDASKYEVRSLGRSEDALIAVDTLYRDGVKSLVLIDLIMPRMDGTGIMGGLELLEMVHNNFPDLPVLAMADLANRDAEQRVRTLGYSLIRKPRSGEIDDPGILAEFGARLGTELARVEAGGGPAEKSSDHVNLGDELRVEMGEVLHVSSGPAVPSTGISLLRGMLEELNNPSLGGGIILLVLRFASEFVNRAVIFMVKRDEIAGLGQFGISDQDGSADQRIRAMHIQRSSETLFDGVIENQMPAKFRPDADLPWCRDFFVQLGGGLPAEVFIGPIVSEGKVVALLYGDNLPAQTPIGDTDSLEIFLSQAGLAMEKALLQRRLKEKHPEAL